MNEQISNPHVIKAGKIVTATFGAVALLMGACALKEATNPKGDLGTYLADAAMTVYSVRKARQASRLFTAQHS